MRPMPSLTGIVTSPSTSPKLEETILRVSVLSTSTVKRPTGWLRTGDRQGSKWTARGNEDYGKREGSITDPDGNVIRFASPIR